MTYTSIFFLEGFSSKKKHYPAAKVVDDFIKKKTICPSKNIAKKKESQKYFEKGRIYEITFYIHSPQKNHKI